MARKTREVQRRTAARVRRVDERATLAQRAAHRRMPSIGRDVERRTAATLSRLARCAALAEHTRDSRVPFVRCTVQRTGVIGISRVNSRSARQQRADSSSMPRFCRCMQWGAAGCALVHRRPSVEQMLDHVQVTAQCS